MRTKSDPMLPYTCYGLDDFRCEYDALARVDPDGDWYKREEVDALIAKMVEALQIAADSFRNLGCAVDADDCEEVIKESLSGGNPGEPKACTGAEERGISGATGAGQLPDGNPGSTVDSAERRSPDGTERTPSPDESNRHLSSKSTVWMAKNRAYSETCYFGHYATAVAWARGGTVVPVEVKHYTPPALHVPKTDLLAEAVRMIQGYQRAGWLTNPAAGEQASDFIARASHEPPQPAEATECRYCDEVMKERDDYHEWADTLAYDIERLVGVEIGEHSNLNSPWGNAHDAAEYELDKRARKPHEPGETCAWAYVDDGSWLTNCGESAILENGGTAYSDMRYCCFCGKPTP